VTAIGTPSPPSLADLFALIVNGVCRVAAAKLAANRAATPLLLVLWSRLQRAIARFARLAAHVDNGTLAPPRPGQPRPGRPRPGRPRPSRPRPEPSDPAPRPPPHPRLPEGFGWLAEWVPETRPYGSQLRHLLTDPRMVDLLRTAPRLARLLRPICRMLAVPPGSLPPAPARARASDRETDCQSDCPTDRPSGAAATAPASAVHADPPGPLSTPA
jgi:HAMP domain-containing protein